MQGSHYFDDQHVLSDDLNNTEETKGEEVRRRTLALITNNNASSGSVVGEYGSTSLQVIKDNDVQFTIAAGAAIDNQGEYIYLASNLTVNHYTYPGTNLEWSTAGSTTFYIKLNYVTSSGSYKQDDLGNSYPTRYTDDYAIQVSSAAPSGSQVLLASFTAGASGEIVGTTLSDERIFIRTRAYDDATYLGNSPIVGHTRVSDHIHAKGSGTQSTTNPHGIALVDLGYSDSSILSHWRDAHTNGIMLLARDETTLSSWSGSVISPVSAAYLTFAPPTTYAIMNVGGALFSGSLASLSASSAPSDGDFWVVADGTATPQFLSTGSYAFDDTNPHKYSAYVRLALVTITDGGDDITSYTDYRDFFAMSQADIRGDFVETTSNPAVDPPVTATLVDNLDRIRYQVGMLVGNNPNSWASAVVAPFSQVVYQDMVSGSVAGIVYAAISNISDPNNFQNINLSDVLTLTGGGNNCTVRAISRGYVFPTYTPIVWQVINGGSGYANGADYTTSADGFGRTHLLTVGTSTPASGQVLQNTSSGSIFVSHAFLADTQMNVYVYMGTTSGSVHNMLIANTTIPASSLGSVFFAVPSGWYYSTILTGTYSWWFTTKYGGATQ